MTALPAAKSGQVSVGALGQIYHSKNTYLKHRIKVFIRLIYSKK